MVIAIAGGVLIIGVVALVVLAERSLHRQRGGTLRRGRDEQRALRRLGNNLWRRGGSGGGGGA